jgi:hypothetical protein
MAKKKKAERAADEPIEPIKARVRLVVQANGELKMWIDDPATLEELESGVHYEAELSLTEWTPTTSADGGDKPPH